jgi:hypothetical protein
MELSLRSLLPGLLLVVSGAAWADAASSYSRGLEAARVRDWPAVQQHMEAAMRAQPEPSQRARLPGLRGEPYVPQYYLGLAAYHQDDCRGARLQWNRSDVMAVIDRFPDLKGSVDSALAECTQRIAALAPARSVPVPDPEPTVMQAPPPKIAVAQPPPSRPLAAAPPAALQNALQAYLEGRYTDVLGLDAARLPDARSRAHGHLLRAAARDALGHLGDTRAGDERALREDVRAARAELPALSLDSVLFSPRFRSRFEQLAGAR